MINCENSERDGVEAMSKVRIIVSEPWGFVNPNTNNNDFYADLVKSNFLVKNFRYTVIKICKPFIYNGNDVHFLLLSNRHDKEDGCYNAFIVDLSSDLSSVKGDLKFTFIVDMQYI